MGSFSIWHWLVVLIIIMLVFGTKKLRNLGSDLGGAVKGFKEGVKEASEDGKADASSGSNSTVQQVEGGATIDATSVEQRQDSKV